MSVENLEAKKYITKLFDSVAMLYDASGPKFFSYFGERLVELCHIQIGKTVLDVASGKGASLLPASIKVGEHGSVLGIDISKEMVNETCNKIKKLGIKNSKISTMDAENLEFSEDTFDYVLCGFAISFFPNYNVALNEFKRVLKLNGRLGLTTFFRWEDEKFLWMKELSQKYMSSKSNIQNKTQINYPEFDTKEGIHKILTEVGFSNIEITIEKKEFIYKDEQEWWDKQWSHGSRALLERIPDHLLKEIKGEVFTRLSEIKTNEGICCTIPVVYTFATK